MFIAGVDEVGRGPLAGPVVAAAVVFRSDYENKNICDSKQLSAKKRELLVEVIKNASIAWAIVSVGHERIRALNIREASKLAMSLAVERVHRSVQATGGTCSMVLVDGNMPINCHLPQRTIVGGDASEVTIGAASILAKVYRDQLMTVLDARFPGYGFAQHAGYPTTTHREAIATLGPCPVHRVTFRGVREYVLPRPQGLLVADCLPRTRSTSATPNNDTFRAQEFTLRKLGNS